MLDNSDLAGDMAMTSHRPEPELEPEPESEPEQPTSWLDAAGAGGSGGMYSDDAMASYNVRIFFLFFLDGSCAQDIPSFVDRGRGPCVARPGDKTDP